MKVLRRTDREILAKVETGSGKPKMSRQFLPFHTRYPRTKNEVSTSNGSKVMTESPKPKVKVKISIFRMFSNSFSNVFEFHGSHCTYVPNMKVLRRTNREILAKVETGSRKPKIPRQVLLIHTRYQHTKNEVSSSNGSKVMTKSPKPEVEIKIYNFSNYRPYTGSTYQI